MKATFISKEKNDCEIYNRIYIRGIRTGAD